MLTYTRKAEFTLINELMENNKLPNLCIAINGLDLQKRSTAIIMVMVNTASIMAMASVMVMAMVMERNIQVGRINKLLLIKPKSNIICVSFKEIRVAVAGTGYVGRSIATLLSQHHHVTAGLLGGCNPGKGGETEQQGFPYPG